MTTQADVTRVEEELELLNARIHRVQKFLAAPGAKGLKAAERSLLVVQLSCMQGYADALHGRIALWLMKV